MGVERQTTRSALLRTFSSVSGGATGTAQISAETDDVHSWITGFAPAHDPQVAVTLVYQNIDYDTGSALTSTKLKDIMEAVVTQ